MWLGGKSGLSEIQQFTTLLASKSRSTKTLKTLVTKTKFNKQLLVWHFIPCQNELYSELQNFLLSAINLQVFNNSIRQTRYHKRVSLVALSWRLSSPPTNTKPDFPQLEQAYIYMYIYMCIYIYSEPALTCRTVFSSVGEEKVRHTHS